MNKSKILLLISEALEVKEKKVNLKTKFGDLEEWDSLGQLEILTKLDEAYDGRVANIRELSECYSVETIIECLIKNKLISR